MKGVMDSIDPDENLNKFIQELSDSRKVVKKCNCRDTMITTDGVNIVCHTCKVPLAPRG